jgi:phosphatidylserine synthase
MTGRAGLMSRQDVLAALRFAAPQVLTSVRIVLAVFAILFALRQQAGFSATLLLLGFATDALDGACARILGVATEFGKLFDFFADYLYFVLAPAAVSLAMAEPAGTLTVCLLALPCVFAGLRYARKALLSETEYPGIPASPGLPTVAYALFVIAVALLGRERALPPPPLAVLLSIGAPLLGLLMIVPARYPKLSVYLWILAPVLAGLAIMPFVFTAILAATTLVLIAVYVLIGPALVQQRAADDGPVRAAARNLCS